MVEQFDGKILGQTRPSSTTAESIYSPDEKTKIARINGLLIVNTTAVPTTFRIFADNDGAVFDEDSALFFDNPLPGSTTVELSFDALPLTLNNSAANIGVATGTANAVTFTLFGEEKAMT